MLHYSPIYYANPSSPDNSATYSPEMFPNPTIWGNAYSESSIPCHYYEPVVRYCPGVYLDEIWNNKRKTGRAHVTSSGAAGLTFDRRPTQRNLHSNKSKSFMIRDILDLRAEETRPYVYDSTYEPLSPGVPLESDMPWNQLQPISPAVFSEKSAESTRHFTPYCMNKCEGQFQDSEKSFDTFISNEDDCNSVSNSLCDSSSRDSAGSPSDKAKRIRTVFSPDQLERLELEFLKTQYMVGSERSQLASELHLNESQVKVWFQNRRIKHRKQLQEQQQAKMTKFNDDRPAEVGEVCIAA